MSSSFCRGFWSFLMFLCLVGGASAQGGRSLSPCGSCRPAIRLVYDAMGIPGGDVCQKATFVHRVLRVKGMPCSNQHKPSCPCLPYSNVGCRVAFEWTFSMRPCSDRDRGCAALSSFHHACQGRHSRPGCDGQYEYTTDDWASVVPDLPVWIGEFHGAYCCDSQNLFGLVCGARGSGPVIVELQITCSDCVQGSRAEPVSEGR